MNDRPLIVIVGPTASGKTALAISLAQKFNGEIICADSRTVYTGMDIGTAKPTPAERALVPHWGLDLVEPGQAFSAAIFQRYAQDKIVEIRALGKLPLLVGGTGLYIDAVVFNYEFGPPANYPQRETLQKMSVDELHNYCKKSNIPLPENVRNKRYLVRSIEQKSINNKRRDTPLPNSIIVGITTRREQLQARMRQRAEHLFDDTVVDEATILGKKYGWGSEAMTGNIYPLIRQYLEGELTFDEMKTRFVTSDWRLAKRQLTWFRRNPFIHWGSLQETEEYIFRRLAR